MTADIGNKMEEEPQSSELALLAASESEFFRKLIDTVPPSVYYRESSREVCENALLVVLFCRVLLQEALSTKKMDLHMD
mgnify:CR=1 FL=1